MNHMCLHLAIIILAQSPGVMTTPILHNAKLSPGPFLGFQKQYELSPPTLWESRLQACTSISSDTSTYLQLRNV